MPRRTARQRSSGTPRAAECDHAARSSHLRYTALLTCPYSSMSSGRTLSSTTCAPGWSKLTVPFSIRPRVPARRRPGGGAVADVAPVLHTRPVNGVDERVRLALGRLGARRPGDRAQHPATVGEHAAGLEPVAGVKDLPRQPSRFAESLDHVAGVDAVGV